MTINPLTEDALTELNISREKAEAVLHYIIDEPQCARQQTLIYIATDYLTEIGDMIRAMQECKITVPQ